MERTRLIENGVCQNKTASATAATGATHIYSLLKDMSREVGTGALKRNVTTQDDNKSEGDFGGRGRVGR